MLSFLSVPRVRHVSLKSYRWSCVPELVHMVSLVLQMIPLSVPAVVFGPALVNLIHCMVSLVLWFVPPGFPELAHGASCVPRQSAVAVRGSGHCGTASAAIVFTELLLTPPLFCQTSQNQPRLPRCVCSYARYGRAAPGRSST